MQNSQAEEFWRQKEIQYSGTITFRTFTRFLGALGDDKRDLTGLLYIINGQLIFEDFEKEGGLFGLLFKAKKSTYEKTVFSIDISQIAEIKEISQGAASSRLSGNPQPAKPISKIGKIFSVVVTEITATDGNSYYFEIMDKTSLTKAVEEARD